MKSRPRRPAKNTATATAITITGGRYRGQKLLSPCSAETHPMGSREKNALFNMAPPTGKRVLDLYAGSGALGLEALSRGAASVVLVEKSPKIAAVITQNLAKLNESAQIIVSPVEKYLAIHPQAETSDSAPDRFDLILADPPYDRFTPSEFQNVAPHLSASGLFILSSPADQPPPDVPDLTLQKTHTYAAARLSLYTRN